MKNNSFARFARTVFIFDISQTFSFFLRREMTCFANMEAWTVSPAQIHGNCRLGDLEPALWRALLVSMMLAAMTTP